MDCSICMEKVCKQEFNCPTCKNSFHETCIEEWAYIPLYGKKNCPLCRGSINPRRIDYIGQPERDLLYWININFILEEPKMVPSRTCNFSRIDNAQLFYTLSRMGGEAYSS